MIRKYLFLSFLFILPCYAMGQDVFGLKIDNAITPSVASYIKRGMTEAQDKGAQAILIEINTPGGLLKATREIVGAIMNAPVPVITYVAPTGSRAASAGLFVTLAGDIAAMSPGTNIGAAHPILLQGRTDSIGNEKMTNDALAFIRSIAEKHGKNVLWAEKAVSESLSFTEEEALEKGLIDLISPNPADLFSRIKEDTISLNGRNRIIGELNPHIHEIPMTFSESLTTLLSDPNLMYVLLLLGLLGIFFEFFNPGAIFPGVIGGIAIILALYSMSILPINYAGLFLIILSIILFVLEIKIASHGILAIGGIISLFLGSVMLIQHEEGAEFLHISLGIIITATLLFTAFFLFAIGMGLRAQKNKITSGKEALIGKTGITITALNPTGQIRISGEIWKAESLSGSIGKNMPVLVEKVTDLKLFVRPATEV